jgi:hypothetical protein
VETEYAVGLYVDEGEAKLVLQHELKKQKTQNTKASQADLVRAP